MTSMRFSDGAYTYKKKTTRRARFLSDKKPVAGLISFATRRRD